MVNGGAVIRFRHGHVIKLREWQEQLSCLYRQTGAYTARLHWSGTAGAIPSERIGNLFRQVRDLLCAKICSSTTVRRGKKLRRQLVEILIMHGQMCALGPGVGYVKQRIARKLALDVEVPLLHVRRFITA